MKKLILLFPLLFVTMVNCGNTNFSSDADIFRKILDREQVEKKEKFSGKIKQISYYQLIKNEKETNDAVKIIGGKAFKGVSVSTYSRNGEKISETNPSYSRIWNYYYNEDNNLICIEGVYFNQDKQVTKKNYGYTIHNEDRLPIQRIEYSIDDRQKISYDDSELITYRAENGKYIIEKKQYTKDHVLDLETREVFDNQLRRIEWDRNLIYTRMNTTWTYLEDHVTKLYKSEDKLRYRYEIETHADNLPDIMKQYDSSGECRNIKSYRYFDNKIEVSSQNYSYNQSYKGDYIKETTTTDGLEVSKIYKDSNGDGYLKTFEYEFDKEGNWIKKSSYWASFEKHVLQDKTLTNIEIREIIYYNNNEEEQKRTLPDLPDEVKELLGKLPQLVDKKQKEIVEYNEAVANDEYDKELTLTEAPDLESFTPRYWKVRDKAFGDLDKDGVDDAVFVYDTPMAGDMDGTLRVLGIFRKTDAGYKLWKQCSSIILDSNSGGVWGDPYDGVTINRGAIIVSHFGGSRDKWTYTSIYRYQDNDWFLIGSKNGAFAGGDYAIVSDYNLSTGKINYSSEKWNVMDESEEPIETINKTFTHKLSSLPKMDEYQLMGNELKFDDITIYY